MLKLEKYAFYDLEKEINFENNRIPEDIIDEWKALEREGKYVVVCSKSTLPYVLGTLHVVGLEHPIIIAEDGGIIQIGLETPPQMYHLFSCSENERKELDYMRNIVCEKFPEVWVQENAVGIVIYPYNQIERKNIEEFLNEKVQNLQSIFIQYYLKSIHIVPMSINIENAVAYLKKWMVRKV